MHARVRERPGARRHQTTGRHVFGDHRLAGTSVNLEPKDVLLGGDIPRDAYGVLECSGTDENTAKSVEWMRGVVKGLKKRK